MNQLCQRLDNLPPFSAALLRAQNQLRLCICPTPWHTEVPTQRALLQADTMDEYKEVFVLAGLNLSDNDLVDVIGSQCYKQNTAESPASVKQNTIAVVEQELAMLVEMNLQYLDCERWDVQILVMGIPAAVWEAAGIKAEHLGNNWAMDLCEAAMMAEARLLRPPQGVPSHGSWSNKFGRDIQNQLCKGANWLHNRLRPPAEYVRPPPTGLTYFGKIKQAQGGRVSFPQPPTVGPAFVHIPAGRQQFWGRPTGASIVAQADAEGLYMDDHTRNAYLALSREGPPARAPAPAGAPRGQAFIRQLEASGQIVSQAFRDPYLHTTETTWVTHDPVDLDWMFEMMTVPSPDSVSP